MTKEEAVRKYPWRHVHGDAWTPQSAWGYKYYTQKDVNEIKRRSPKATFSPTTVELDGERILRLIAKAAAQ